MFFHAKVRARSSLKDALRLDSLKTLSRITCRHVPCRHRLINDDMECSLSSRVIFCDDMDGYIDQ